MEERDLKERIYKYYDLVRKELTSAKLKLGSNEEKGRGFGFSKKEPKRPKKNPMKWRSKGH